MPEPTPKTPAAPPAAPEPEIPNEITLAADYAWFASGQLVHRNAGEIINDPTEVKYLLSIDAKLKA
jgi:hypothetical protein